MALKIFPQSVFVRRYLLVMGVLLGGVVLSGMAFLSAKRVESGTDSRSAPAQSDDLPILGEVDGFSLTDQEGRTFTTDALDGRAYVADFIFTSCAGVCPTMTAAMAQLHDAYADDDRVRFVSITVDPETDTPDVLSWYAGRYDADPARWHFLTGPATEIESIARDQFLVGSGDEPINHSARFILVDGSGQIRGFYHGTEPASVDALRRDLQRLLGSE